MNFEQLNRSKYRKKVAANEYEIITCHFFIVNYYRLFIDETNSFSFFFMLSQNSLYVFAVLHISIPKIDSEEPSFRREEPSFKYEVGIYVYLLSNGDTNPPFFTLQATRYAIS